jgi:hypothetical protein
LTVSRRGAGLAEYNSASLLLRAAFTVIADAGASDERRRSLSLLWTAIFHVGPCPILVSAPTPTADPPLTTSHGRDITQPPRYAMLLLCEPTAPADARTANSGGQRLVGPAGIPEGFNRRVAAGQPQALEGDSARVDSSVSLSSSQPSRLRTSPGNGTVGHGWGCGQSHCHPCYAEGAGLADSLPRELKTSPWPSERGSTHLFKGSPPALLRWDLS